MTALRDLTGYRKGRITVIKRAGTKIYGKNKIRKVATWLCKCDCGREFIATSTGIIHNNYNSCGCYRSEFIRRINSDGTFKTTAMRQWNNLVKKCTDPNDRRYFLYGGRGTTLCDEWLNFDNFFEWIKTQIKNPNYTIELKDKKGIYEPDNCFVMPKPKAAREKNETIRRKFCYLPEKEWEELARGAATMVLKEEELYSYFDKHEPYPYVFPEYASKLLDMGVNTFKKYARKYLMPEIYGNLPDDFFKPESEKYEKMKKLPRLE